MEQAAAFHSFFPQRARAQSSRLLRKNRCSCIAALALSKESSLFCSVSLAFFLSARRCLKYYSFSSTTYTKRAYYCLNGFQSNALRQTCVLTLASFKMEV